MKQKTSVTALMIVLIVLGVLYWYWAELIPKSRGPVVTPLGSGPAPEDVKAKQLQELEALRAQLPPSPKTSEEQLKELNALRNKLNVAPLSDAEISKQLEELEKLRKSQ